MQVAETGTATSVAEGGVAGAVAPEGGQAALEESPSQKMWSMLKVSSQH